jgi:hypothetical protein
LCRNENKVGVGSVPPASRALQLIKWPKTASSWALCVLLLSVLQLSRGHVGRGKRNPIAPLYQTTCVSAAAALNVHIRYLDVAITVRRERLYMCAFVLAVIDVNL